MKRLFFTLTLLLFSLSSISAQELFPTPSADIEVGLGSGTGQTGVNVFIPEEILNVSASNTNSSDFWNTNLGPLDNANAAQFDNIAGTLTIDESHFDLLYCQLTGCNMSGNIDMGGNDIVNLDTIQMTTLINMQRNVPDPLTPMINVSNANTFGTSLIRLENDIGAQLALGIFGLGISQDQFGEQLGNLTAMGLSNRGGPLSFATRDNHSLFFGGSPSDNLNESQFTIRMDTSTHALVFQGDKFFVPIRVDGGFGLAAFSNSTLVEGGVPHADLARDANGDLIITSAQQNARNNSMSFNMNSFGPLPKSWIQVNIPQNKTIIDFTAAGNDSAEFIFNITNYIQYCDFLQNNLSLVPEGCKYFADTTGRLVPLLFGGDGEIHRTFTVHEGTILFNDFDFIGRNGNDVDFLFNGGFEFGKFQIRDVRQITANFTNFSAIVCDFDDATVCGFNVISSPPDPVNEWQSVVDETNCHDDRCARAAGSFHNMSFTTGFLNTSDINASFWLTTTFVGLGDNFSVVIDDNLGNVTTIYNQTAAVSDILVSFILPSVYEDKENITAIFICDAKPGKECFVDDIGFSLTFTPPQEINETFNGGRMVLGEDRNSLSCGVEVDKQINNATLQPEWVMTMGCPDGVTRILGNATFVDTTVENQTIIGDQLITGNSTVEGTIFTDRIENLTAAGINISTNINTILNSKVGTPNTNLSGTGLDITGRGAYLSTKGSTGFAVGVQIDGPSSEILMGSSNSPINERVYQKIFLSGEMLETMVTDTGAIAFNHKIFDTGTGTTAFSTNSSTDILVINDSSGNIEATGFYKGQGIRSSSVSGNIFDITGVSQQSFVFKQNQQNIFMKAENWNGETLMETLGGRGRWLFSNYAGGGASPGFHIKDFGFGVGPIDDLFTVEGNGSGRFLRVTPSGKVAIGDLNNDNIFLQNDKAIYQAIGNTTVTFWEGTNGLTGLDGQVAILGDGDDSASLSFLSSSANTTFFSNPSFVFPYLDNKLILNFFATSGPAAVFEKQINTTHPNNIRDFYGTNNNLSIYFDSSDARIDANTKLIINATNITLHSNGGTHIMNNSGYGALHYKQLVAHTSVDNSSDALEYFSTGDALIKPDGSINYSAYGECYWAENQTDYSRPVYHYWTEPNCIKAKQPGACHNVVTPGKTKCKMEQVPYEEIITVEEASHFTGENVTVNRTIVVYREEQVCKTGEDKVEEVCADPITNEFCVDEEKFNITYPYQFLNEGVDRECQMGKMNQGLGLMGENINLYDNLTDFDTGIMAESIYTQSKVIDLVTNYALKFLNRTSLASKETHKNKFYIDNSNVPEDKRDVLDMEDRTVDLEGAFSNHMTCLANHKKYEDYRICMGITS